MSPDGRNLCNSRFAFAFHLVPRLTTVDTKRIALRQLLTEAAVRHQLQRVRRSSLAAAKANPSFHRVHPTPQTARP
jgi:hypothetical protein